MLATHVASAAKLVPIVAVAAFYVNNKKAEKREELQKTINRVAGKPVNTANWDPNLLEVVGVLANEELSCKRKGKRTMFHIVQHLITAHNRHRPASVTRKHFFDATGLLDALKHAVPKFDIMQRERFAFYCAVAHKSVEQIVDNQFENTLNF